MARAMEKTLHHAAGKSAHHLIGAVTKFEAVEQRVGTLGALVRIDSEISAVEEQNLARGEGEIKIGTLRHDSNQPFDGNLFFPDIEVANPCLASRGRTRVVRIPAVVDLPAPLGRAGRRFLPAKSQARGRRERQFPVWGAFSLYFAQAEAKPAAGG